VQNLRCAFASTYMCKPILCKPSGIPSGPIQVLTDCITGILQKLRFCTPSVYPKGFACKRVYAKAKLLIDTSRIRLPVSKPSVLHVSGYSEAFDSTYMCKTFAFVRYIPFGPVGYTRGRSCAKAKLLQATYGFAR
jgi:hypothetical protein